MVRRHRARISRFSRRPLSGWRRDGTTKRHDWSAKRDNRWRALPKTAETTRRISRRGKRDGRNGPIRRVARDLIKRVVDFSCARATGLFVKQTV